MEKKKLPGRPPSSDKANSKVPSAERGTKVGEGRKTYIVNSELAGKIDEIAYINRITVKEVVYEAFSDKVAKWEKKNGPVVLPKKKK